MKEHCNTAVVTKGCVVALRTHHRDSTQSLRPEWPANRRPASPPGGERTDRRRNGQAASTRRRRNIGYHERSVTPWRRLCKRCRRGWGEIEPWFWSSGPVGAQATGREWACCRNRCLDRVRARLGLAPVRLLRSPPLRFRMAVGHGGSWWSGGNFRASRRSVARRTELGGRRPRPPGAVRNRSNALRPASWGRCAGAGSGSRRKSRSCAGARCPCYREWDRDSPNSRTCVALGRRRTRRRRFRQTDSLRI